METKPLKLIRTATAPDGTNSKFIFPDGNVILAIEREWRQNLVQNSCIPNGTYRVLPIQHHQYGKCYLIDGVKSRTEILIHPANVAFMELKGCIAPVTEYRQKIGQGVNSRPALKRFVELCISNFGDTSFIMVVSSIIFEI